MRLAALAVVGVVVVGCVTRHEIGDKRISDDSLIAKLKEGETTKDDARKFFGEPTNVDWTELGEKWLYTFTSMRVEDYSALGSFAVLAGNNIRNDVMTLTLLFDEEGRLKKFHRGAQASRTTLLGGTKPLGEDAEEPELDQGEAVAAEEPSPPAKTTIKTKPPKPRRSTMRPRKY